jgi:rubrerythrin
MHAEAFAAAKYKRFAAFARARGNNDLARLFSDAADENRIGHFAQELQLAGLISDDMANLRDAIRDKRYDIERYKQFAEEAERNGDVNAADLFRRVVTDDEHELAKLERALKKAGQPEP